MLKHIQARVREEDFKRIKKAAVDLGMTVEEFIRTSALEKIERKTTRKEGITVVVTSGQDNYT